MTAKENKRLAEILVSEIIGDREREFKNGWNLLSSTLKRAMVLDKAIGYLCSRETSRSGVISCDELNAIRLAIDELI